MLALTAFRTILRKEVNRFMRIWSQTLLPPIITQSLYFLIFGNFIGSQIEDLVFQTPEGAKTISYMAFIVPGLVMMAAINSSFSNVVSSFFGAKFQRSIEEILVSPTPNWVIVAGYTMGGVLRGMLVSLVVFLVSFLFVRPQIENPILVLTFALLTAIVFSLAGLLNGIFAKKFDDVSIFPTFILTPLTYLGGIFYSINDLPAFWQNVSKLNPIVYMINGFRYGFYGVSDTNVWVSLTMLVGFTVLLVAINLHLLHKGTGLRS